MTGGTLQPDISTPTPTPTSTSTPTPTSTSSSLATPTPPDEDPDDPDDDDDDSQETIPGDFLEGDSDSGGEGPLGNDANSVANGLLGTVGAGSTALNSLAEGSTTTVCGLLGCAAAAQSNGNVSTAVGGAEVNVEGGLTINVSGPLVEVTVVRVDGGRRRTSSTTSTVMSSSTVVSSPTSLPAKSTGTAVPMMP